MKVRCRFCKFESDSTCNKNIKQGHPVKIKLNKPRVCEMYEDDSHKLLIDFRKKEHHKKVLLQSLKQQTLEGVEK